MIPVQPDIALIAKEQSFGEKMWINGVLLWIDYEIDGRYFTGDPNEKPDPEVVIYSVFDEHHKIVTGEWRLHLEQILLPSLSLNG